MVAVTTLFKTNIFQTSDWFRHALTCTHHIHVSEQPWTLETLEITRLKSEQFIHIKREHENLHRLVKKICTTNTRLKRYRKKSAEIWAWISFIQILTGNTKTLKIWTKYVKSNWLQSSQLFLLRNKIKNQALFCRQS
jgi:hypothetical protein